MDLITTQQEPIVKKKKVVFHSTFSKLKTGFARNAKEILKYLYSTGKYELIEYAAAPVAWQDARTKEMPWKCYGALPEDLNSLNHIQDPGLIRHIHYGGGNIDRLIKEEKPDIYIGVEDIWAFQGYWDKQWWKALTPVIWTTLDSLPIYPIAHENANKIPNYWVWASFAEKELKSLGHQHVKTLHGAFNLEQFFALSEDKKIALRKNFNISQDTKIFGFVFRNQLRKLVGSLLEGFALFKKNNPNSNAKVLLHTHWGEGWNIVEFIKEFGIDNNDVLTTYICSNCKNIDIHPFVGLECGCRFCGQNTAKTTSVGEGCTEEQLNYIYNIMDAYVHPMTSGGLEMPIVEAMLTELPVATVPYSCGTEFTDNDFVYSLSYSEYREINSNFIKASPSVDSIANFLTRVCKNPEKFKIKGKQSRDWALENFDVNEIGKKIERFIDSAPFANQEKLELAFAPKKVDYPNPDIQDDTEWLIDIYKNILNMDERVNSEGVLHWLGRLKVGVTREQIYQFFINEAYKGNGGKNLVSIDSFFKKDDNRKRIVYIMPRSLGDCVLSLNVLKQIRKDYPVEDWSLYVCSMTENAEIFLPFIGEMLDGFIPYKEDMDNYKFWEGFGSYPGICDIAFMPYGVTQKFESYTHNGLDLNLLQNAPIRNLQ